MQKICILACLLAVTSMPAFALGPTRTATGSISVDQNKPYRLEVDVGYSVYKSKSDAATTNSRKENLAAHVLFQRQAGVWGQEVRAEAITATDNTSTNNTEQYYLSGKLLHRSTDTIYEFAKLSAEKDLTSAYDYQITALAGVGMDVLKTKEQKLSVELGAGARHNKVDLTGNTENEVIGSVAGFYQYQINPTVRFNQDLSYEFGQDSRTLRSRTALSADLTQKIAAVASYNLKDLKADVGDSRTSLMSLGVRYKH